MIRRIKMAYHNWKLRRWAKRIAGVTREIHEATEHMNKLTDLWKQQSDKTPPPTVRSWTNDEMRDLLGFNDKDVS